MEGTDVNAIINRNTFCLVTEREELQNSLVDSINFAQNNPSVLTEFGNAQERISLHPDSDSIVIRDNDVDQGTFCSS